MPLLHVNTAHVAASLRDAATTLKAAIVVSAAAILSQAKPDLDANAAAAVDHLDTFRSKLEALHDGILQNSGNAAALAIISRTGSTQIDPGILDARIAIMASQIERLKDALFDVVGSALRNGVDDYAEFVGILGRTFQDFAFSAGQPADLIPFQYEQFFLESIAELDQRDWSDATDKR